MHVEGNAGSVTTAEGANYEVDQWAIDLASNGLKSWVAQATATYSDFVHLGRATIDFVEQDGDEAVHWTGTVIIKGEMPSGYDVILSLQGTGPLYRGGRPV